MPRYEIAGVELDLSRDVMLVDSNVLIAAFCPTEPEGKKDHARFILEDLGRPLLVPIAVVVEAVGFIIGRQGNRPAALDLLVWLNTPGRVTIIPSHRLDVGETYRLMGRLSIDCVDAMLADLATDITSVCSLIPAIPIVTSDTRDFGRMSKRDGLRLSIFNFETLDEYEIG